MAWISFTVFDLGAAITGGLFVNIGDAITILMEMALGDQAGGLGLSIIVGGIIAVAMVTIFPLHWVLQYRPDEPLYALAVILPWILCTFISALLFAKTMKEGFLTGVFIGLGYMILGLVIVIGLKAVLESGVPGGSALIDGVFRGLTDNPPETAIILACLEGGLIGGVFGALAGAIRYNPNAEAEGYVPKAAQSNAPAFGSQSYATSIPPPSYAQTSAPPTAPPTYAAATDSAPKDFCTNCGAKLQEGLQFCMNCGQKT